LSELGDNIFYGYGGDDTVLHSGGSDYFDGGSGHDTLTGFGLRREYGNISLGGGNATVGGATAGAVETFQFTDGRFVTEVNDVEAQVFRLYGAVNRLRITSQHRRPISSHSSGCRTPCPGSPREGPARAAECPSWPT
jgi:hypothetical protein